MDFQYSVSHRARMDQMVVEIRDYEIESDEEFLMETSRLRISSALDLNAAAHNPVAVWQELTKHEWVPQHQIAVFPPDIPVRVRIPKGVHRTLGIILDQETSHRWPPTALKEAHCLADERIHQIATLLSRELKRDRLAAPQMITGLSKLFTRHVGRKLESLKSQSPHALITWRMRTIEDAIKLAAKGSDLDLDELAAQCRMSRQYLLSQFRQATGVSLGDYLWSARAEQAKRLIKKNHSFCSIANRLNYSGLSHFSSRFSRSTGISPSKFRQQVRHQE